MVSFPEDFDKTLSDALYSPETSGGLLLFMSQRDADKYVKRMDGDAFVIGEVREKAEKKVIII